MTRIRRGFTLIELLIVVVVIGILVSIVIPKFSTTRGMAYSAAIRQDLRQLAVAQEDYFIKWGRYSAATTNLPYLSSPGVSVSIVEATADGWSAKGEDPRAYPITCAVYWGPVAPLAPAEAEGQVNCD